MRRLDKEIHFKKRIYYTEEDPHIEDRNVCKLYIINIFNLFNLYVLSRSNNCVGSYG